MMTSKKILVISPFDPWPLSNGAIVRTHHLVTYLAQHNEVWFAHRGGSAQPAGSPVQHPIANTANRYLQLFNPLFLWRLRRLVPRRQLDLILVSHFWSGVHGLLLKLLTGKPLLLDHHNVEYVRLRRSGSRVWPFAGLLEWITCRSADKIYCVSDTDKEQLREKMRLPPGKLEVVANGVDVERFCRRNVDSAAVKQALDVQPEERMLLFFGTLKYPPNAQAVDVILEKLVPRLAAARVAGRIVIVGPGQRDYLQSRTQPPPEQVRFAGFVSDIVAVLKSADLVIVPLTAGSGTRLKIIESVAAGRRVVSTSVGAEGLDRAVFGEALTICDDWDAFAAAVERNLNLPRHVPPSPAFTAAYSWQSIFARSSLAGVDEA